MQFATSIAGRTAALATTALIMSSSASLAAGDPAAGQHVFAECGGCHSTSPGVNKIGPSLAGVVGRKSGTVAGYSYSPTRHATATTAIAAAL